VPELALRLADVSRALGLVGRSLRAEIPELDVFHMAISRISGQTRLFRDGVQQGSTYADASNYTST
jgi:hypothetical protein